MEHGGRRGRRLACSPGDIVIARTWGGTANPEQAAAYLAHVTGPVMTLLRTLPGHEGAWVLRRDTPLGVEFIVVTLWASLEAIRGFAGEHIEAAVVHPDAQARLTRWDTAVGHYEVAFRES